MKGVVKILGIFFSVESEASILEENWNTKLDNLIRSIKQTMGEPESNTIWKSYPRKNPVAVTILPHSASPSLTTAHTHGNQHSCIYVLVEKEV